MARHKFIGCPVFQWWSQIPVSAQLEDCGYLALMTLICVMHNHPDPTRLDRDFSGVAVRTADSSRVAVMISAGKPLKAYRPDGTLWQLHRGSVFTPINSRAPSYQTIAASRKTPCPVRWYHHGRRATCRHAGPRTDHAADRVSDATIERARKCTWIWPSSKFNLSYGGWLEGEGWDTGLRQARLPSQREVAACSQLDEAVRQTLHGRLACFSAESYQRAAKMLNIDLALPLHENGLIPFLSTWKLAAVLAREQDPRVPVPQRWRRQLSDWHEKDGPHSPLSHSYLVGCENAKSC